MGCRDINFRGLLGLRGKTVFTLDLSSGVTSSNLVGGTEIIGLKRNSQKDYPVVGTNYPIFPKGYTADT